MKNLGEWKVGAPNTSNDTINSIREIAAEFIDLLEGATPILEKEGDEETDVQIEQMNKICQAIDYIEIATFLAETAILKKERI